MRQVSKSDSDEVVFGKITENQMAQPASMYTDLILRAGRIDNTAFNKLSMKQPAPTETDEIIGLAGIYTGLGHDVIIVSNEESKYANTEFKVVFPNVVKNP